VKADTLLACGSFRKNVPYGKLSSLCSDAVESAMVFSPEVLAMEQPWIDLRRDPSTGKMLRDLRTPLTLCRKSGIWIAEWYSQGGRGEPEFYEPGSWRKNVLSSRSGRAPRKEAKDHAILMVRAIYRRTDLDEDTCEAIGIARMASLRIEW
jgi:hypothetical protein